LIEWPNRLGSDVLPKERLDIRITIPDQSSVERDPEDDERDCRRHMLLQPHGIAWNQRLRHLLEQGYIDDLLVVEKHS
jgi:hypothetical protein